METHYPDMNIQFTLEQHKIDVQNIVLTQFSKVIPAHSHGNNCYEIHYIPSGYGKLDVDGIRYDIRPNTIFVTGPHIMHAQAPLSNNPMTEYCVYLKLHDTVTDSQTFPVLSAFCSAPFWFGQAAHGLSDIIPRFFWELEHRYIGYQSQAETLLSQMIVALARCYEQRRDLSKITLEQTADNKSILIEEYFLYEYQSLSLEALADRLSLSPRQTQRLLQKYYGKTFQQKKAEARMSAAALLLEDGRQSITSIADLLGYSSVEHFSSAFHKYFKTSPREYRKKILKP